MENLTTAAPTQGITVEEFDAYIADWCAFWALAETVLEADDELFDDGSVPAPLEVVENCARECEISLALGASDAKEVELLGCTIRNATGTLEAIRSGALVMGRIALANLLRQLSAARTRLAQLWTSIEFEFALDREDVFA